MNKNAKNAGQVLADLLSLNQRYHSEFQMDSFITVQSGYGHPFGMFRQAVRELHSRTVGLRDGYRQLQEEELDLQELELNLEDLRFRIMSAGTEEQKQHARLGIEESRLEIQVKRKKDAVVNLEIDLRHREREFRRFFSQAIHLRGQLGDLSDPDYLRRCDEDYWYTRLRSKIAIDTLREGMPSINTLEIVYHTSGKVREELMRDVENPDRAVLWWKGRAPVELSQAADGLDALPALEREDLRQLVKP